MDLRLRKRSNTGPTPAAPHGQPGVARTTDYKAVHQPQPGKPDMGGHKDSGDKHPASPPQTPQVVAKNATRTSAPPVSGGPVMTTAPAKSMSSAHGMGTVSYSQGQPGMGNKTTAALGGMPTGPGTKKQPGHPSGMGAQKGGMDGTRPPMPAQRNVKRKIGKPVGGMRGRVNL